MKRWLVFALLFSMGSLTGWIIEVIFRRFFSSANPERKWINPGFLIGPYVPLYGLSLCIIYLLSMIDVSFIGNSILQKTVLFILMALSITWLEYIAGLIFIKKMHVKLWDYSDEFGNIQGIICIKFTCFWYLLSAFYYFCIHPVIIHFIEWLSLNLTFSFFIGLFYGIFFVDVFVSLNLLTHIKELTKDNDVIVHFEQFKMHIDKLRRNFHEKRHFLFFMKIVIIRKEQHHQSHKVHHQFY